MLFRLLLSSAHTDRFVIGMPVVPSLIAGIGPIFNLDRTDGILAVCSGMGADPDGVQSPSKRIHGRRQRVHGLPYGQVKLHSGR